MSEYRVERDSISEVRDPRAGLRWRGDSNCCSKLYHFGMPPTCCADQGRHTSKHRRLRCGSGGESLDGNESQSFDRL